MSNEEKEKPNQELQNEVVRLEKRLTNCKEEKANERHDTGLMKTRLAFLQSQFIANLSHIEKPNIGIKFNFDSMDEYVDKLQAILLGGRDGENQNLIRHLKEALADFKF